MWLPGWKTIFVPTGQTVYEKHKDECDWMIGVGEALYNLGALPRFTEAEKEKLPKTHLEGTGGNLAMRSIRDPRKFIVTTAGCDKGALDCHNFAVVHRIVWQEKVIEFSATSEEAYPSTDTLLVGAIFEESDYCRACIHIHSPVETAYALRLKYPLNNAKDVIPVRRFAKAKIEIFNLIDHLVTDECGREDAACITGKYAKEVSSLAIELVANYRKNRAPAIGSF